MTQNALPAHSPLGPSSAERWLNCPGSVSASRGVSESPSRFAAEGTAAHTLSEWCRRQNCSAAFYRGRTIVADGFEFIVDQEMIDGVQEFVDRCDELSGDGYYEERVTYDEWVAEGFGTADDIRIDDDVCVVTDLKYGKGVQVFAKGNPQLMLYALGVYLKYRHLYRFDRVVMRICQPRINHFDEWETTIQDLVNWAVAVASPSAKETESLTPRFAAGDHCRFCRIKATCVTRAKWAMKQVTGSSSDFEDLDTLITAAQVGPTAAEMTSAEVANCLNVLDSVTAWAKDIKAHAMREIQQGYAVGDWKLVAGRSYRKFTIPDDEVADTLRLEEELNEDQIYTKKLTSPAKLEKIIGKKHELMKSPEEGGIVRKGPGKPKLAPGSDPRPALTIDAMKEFDDLDEEDEDDE